MKSIVDINFSDIKGDQSMDVKDLEIFQAVAKHNSISKAALELNYVQSNVTNRMNKLETELKTTLLYRNNRGVRLTSDGKLLLGYTERILQLFKEAEDALTNSEFPSGQLAIGATDITTAVRLPPILSTYHRTYPEVDLSIKTASTEELVDEVLNYRLDGAFITDSIDHPNLIQDVLVEEELVWMMDKYAPTIHTIQDLQQHTVLVFRPGCTYRNKLETWLRNEGVLPIKKMEFGTIEGMLGCVKAGLGVALVSKQLALQFKEERTMHFYSIPNKEERVTTVFIRRHDVHCSHALTKFLHVTKQAFVESERGTK